MFVRTWMSSPALALLAETPLPEAARFMEGKRIRHVAVLGSKGLLGMVSCTDLYRRLATGGVDGWYDRKTLGDIVAQPPPLLQKDLPVERAAEMMLLHHASALPVLEEGRLAGVIGATDIVRAFIYLLGVCEGGARLHLTASDTGDILDEIRERSCGLSIQSLVVCPNPSGGREVVMRVRGRGAVSVA